jgi:hypothetical protein
MIRSCSQELKSLLCRRHPYAILANEKPRFAPLNSAEQDDSAIETVSGSSRRKVWVCEATLERIVGLLGVRRLDLDSLLKRLCAHQLLEGTVDVLATLLAARGTRVLAISVTLRVRPSLSGWRLLARDAAGVAIVSARSLKGAA